MKIWRFVEKERIARNNPAYIFKVRRNTAICLEELNFDIEGKEKEDIGNFILYHNELGEPYKGQNVTEISLVKRR